MLRRNTRERDEALQKLRDIVSESINSNNPQRSRTQLFQWTTRYLPPGEWNSAKSFWRKIL